MTSNRVYEKGRKSTRLGALGVGLNPLMFNALQLE